MEQKLIDAFSAATEEVISQMALTKLNPVDRPADDDKPISSFINSSIGLIGDVIFTFTVGFSKDAVHNLHRTVFPDEEKFTLSSLGDLVGEMSNMICGRARGILAEWGIRFEASIPSVVIGDRCYIHTTPGTKMYVLPFSVGDSTMFIELNIKVPSLPQ